MPFRSWSFLCLAISAKSFHWIGLKFVLNIQEILRTPSIMFPFKYLLLNGYSKQIINRKSLLPGWRICHFQKCKSPPVFTFLQPNLVLSSIDVVLTHLDVNWVCIKKHKSCVDCFRAEKYSFWVILTVEFPKKYFSYFDFIYRIQRCYITS